jgi:hypothetical protein
MKDIAQHGITATKQKCKIDVLKHFLLCFDTYDIKSLSIDLNMPVLSLINEIDSIKGWEYMTVTTKALYLKAKGFENEEINLTLNIKR